MPHGTIGRTCDCLQKKAAEWIRRLPVFGGTAVALSKRTAPTGTGMAFLAILRSLHGIRRRLFNGRVIRPVDLPRFFGPERMLEFVLENAPFLEANHAGPGASASPAYGLTRVIEIGRLVFERRNGTGLEVVLIVHIVAFLPRLRGLCPSERHAAGIFVNFRPLYFFPAISRVTVSVLLMALPGQASTQAMHLLHSSGPS